MTVMTEPAISSLVAPWTEADLDALPGKGNRFEIIEGRLIVTPPGTDKHGRLQLALGAVILSAAPGAYIVLTECGIRIPGGNLVADVAVLHPFGRRGVTWREARDVALVVEIASPSSAQFDATDKLASYARAGIPSYWRVEQDTTTHVYQLGGGEYKEIELVRPGTAWTASAPFEVTLRPADWLPEE